MTLILNPAARNIMANALAAKLSGGTLNIENNATVMASVQLANPAFGPAANGIITGAAIPEIIITTAGTATRFTIRSSDGLVEVAGTITGDKGGGDMETLRPDLIANEGMRVTAITLTMPATA